MLDVEFNNVAILSKNFRYKFVINFDKNSRVREARSEKREADNGKKRKIFVFHFSLKAKENKLINSSLKEEKKNNEIKERGRIK